MCGFIIFEIFGLHSYDSCYEEITEALKMKSLCISVCYTIGVSIFECVFVL